MPLDRRDFVTLGAGALLGANSACVDAPEDRQSEHSNMLPPRKGSGFDSSVLMTTGDNFDGYQAPGIMDGMGIWSINESIARLFVNHELPPDASYIYALENGTRLRGARISWFDIDKSNRQIVGAGNAIRNIYDRRGDVVTTPEQVNEHWDTPSYKGLNNLCSAKGYQAGEFGFVDDLLFTHEEVSAVEDHPHGGSVWTMDVQTGDLWALPELGRGSWENVSAVATPDQQAQDGRIALLLSDDMQFGGAPLYLWIGQKQPAGNFIARNGLAVGQLHVWAPEDGARSPQDWHGTGTARDGHFVPVTARDIRQGGTAGYDRDGFIDDPGLRDQAVRRGAFLFSRPEDIHTNPANGNSVVLCSTGHGGRFPADDWGTIYLLDVTINKLDERIPATAHISILHDADDFGDSGIRSPDNVVWASDGMIYVHEDKATKINDFGGATGREASTWRIDPDNPADYRVIAEIDRRVILPRNARDVRANVIGEWECCGLLDVSAALGAAPDELLLITAVQAHTLRGGALGGREELMQGGQLILLSGTT